MIEGERVVNFNPEAAAIFDRTFNSRAAIAPDLAQVIEEPVVDNTATQTTPNIVGNAAPVYFNKFGGGLAAAIAG